MPDILNFYATHAMRATLHEEKRLMAENNKAHQANPRLFAGFDDQIDIRKVSSMAWDLARVMVSLRGNCGPERDLFAAYAMTEFHCSAVQAAKAVADLGGIGDVDYFDIARKSFAMADAMIADTQEFAV